MCTVLLLGWRDIGERKGGTDRLASSLRQVREMAPFELRFVLMLVSRDWLGRDLSLPCSLVVRTTTLVPVNKRAPCRITGTGQDFHHERVFVTSFLYTSLLPYQSSGFTITVCFD